MVFKPGSYSGGAPEVETEYPARALLETSVAHALSVSGGLDASEVGVRVHGSRVTLSGLVTLKTEIARASDIAAAVEGVTEVDNRLIARSENPETERW